VLESVVDIETLTEIERPERLELNDIGRVAFRLAEPLAVDPYAQNHATGAFILIDESTNETVGAGMVLHAQIS
jgi:sulfate adenylyltransferase subunit 1